MKKVINKKIMNKKSQALVIIILLILVIAVGIGLYFFLSDQNSEGSADNDENGLKLINGEDIDETDGTNDQTETMNIVEITSSGFSPKTITIKKGETLTFVNKDSRSHWPASAAHPTHTTYPGSNINKCGTYEESRIFDACRGLGRGETYTYTFNEIGSWNYHDHLNPGFTGTVVVE